MVMAQALFKLRQSRFPDEHIDVLAPGWSLPIIRRMPEVRSSIASETAHGEVGIGKRYELGKQLRQMSYDRAIILPRSLKASLIPWFARIPKRVGFRGESRYGLINDMRPFDRQVLNQTVKRFVALGLERDEVLPDIPLPALAVNPDNQQQKIRELNLDISKPVVAMMPGAEYGPAKCWPHAHFAALARELEDLGFSVWILGSDKDSPAGEAIAAASAAVNLCGQTSLEDVVDLLALTRHAVSNDSGLMHIAAAVGTHVHALYGSSSPDFTPPLTRKRHIHSLNLECSPCFARECPLGHLNCLHELTPDRVLGAIELVAKSD